MKDSVDPTHYPHHLHILRPLQRMAAMPHMHLSLQKQLCVVSDHEAVSCVAANFIKFRQGIF